MKPILRKIDTGYQHSFSVREDIYPYLYNHWHYHPELELTYIRKGKGLRLVGTSMEEFRDGDLIFVGSNLPHVWRSDEIYFKGLPNLHIEAIAIHFREDFWGKDFLNMPEMLPVRQLFERARKGLKISGTTKKKLIPKMEAILKAGELERVELLLQMLRLIAATENYSYLSVEGFTKSYNASNTDRINLIYAYTFNHFQKPISIEKVANAVNISPNSFCRYFKNHTLKSYWQFLLEVRIGYACKLLIENRISVANVCYESGFNNLSNFNRQFRKILKMTPGQYVKLYLQDKTAR